MAENIEKIEDFKFKEGQVASRELTRKFGRPEDYAELHILSISNQVLNSDLNFTNYNTLPEATDKEGLISEINMDPVNELKTLGYTSGKYKVKLNLLRRKILNTNLSVFFLKEISSSRREIKLKLNNAFNNSETVSSIRSFINEIESNIFFKDFGLNFKDGNVLTAINIAIDERETKPSILIKLLEPLPINYIIDDQCSIVEEIIDSTVLTINLGRLEDIDDSISLQGPNFKIDTKLNSSIPSGFKTYDNILNSSTVLSSSYNELLSNLTDEDVLNIPYDYIRPISGTLEDIDIPSHFENFVHFGSSVERLKNFDYKLKLIELYDSQLSNINSITGDTSASSAVITNRNSTTLKKDNVIKGFDGYERFLYFTSGSKYTWPKVNQTTPYTLYPTTSSQAKTWLGDDRSSFSYYGGQLLSASIYDKGNVNNLERLIPNHILDNEDNDQYKLFVNMIGQHFDNVWTHIRHITEINDTHHTKGISRDLVYFTLKSLGVEAFDQFENSNLIEYILGQGTSGSAFYDTPGQQTLVTASNAGSLPKKDLSKEVWKRLYHNAPYLLKTKGTERGIKALISCYGIPSTILNIKEYGGPVKDKTGYKTFSYEKSGLALDGRTDNIGNSGQYFIKTAWSSSFTQYLLGHTNQNLDQPANTYSVHTDSTINPFLPGFGPNNVTYNYNRSPQKTITFRIKPHRSTSQYHLFGLSGSSITDDPHFVLTPYTGNDISSSGDFTQYGKIDLYVNNNVISSTPNFPVYNGDFWNIFIGVDEDYNQDGEYYSGSFGAYQANFNKNISNHIGYFALNSGTSFTDPNGVFHLSIDNSFGGQETNVSTISATTASTEIFTIDANADLSSTNFQDYDLTITDFYGQEVTIRHNPTLPVATSNSGFPQTIVTSSPNIVEANWNFYNNIILPIPNQSSVPVDVEMTLADSINQVIKYSVGVALDNGFFTDPINEDFDTIFFKLIEQGNAPYNQGINPFTPSSFQPLTIVDSFLLQSTIPGTSNQLNLTFGDLFVSDILLDSAPSTPTGFTGGFDAVPGQNAIAGAGASHALFGGFEGASTSTISSLGYSGSLQEIKYYYGELLTHDTLKKQALEPFMYAGNTISSSFNHLVLRLPLGSNDQQDSSSFHSNNEIKFLGGGESNMTIQTWKEIIETHHHLTPDTVGISMTSEKVRIDEGTIDDNLLSTTVKSEVSTLDRQPQDFEDLGVFFSPTTELNEDIVYQLGAFRLDDYIGSPLPSAQTAPNYTDLKALRKEYFKRVERRYNYWDYVKLIQYIDHTLFKLVEQFVPAKANLKTGLLIEPHYLERTKFARELPIIEDGQTMTPGSYNTIDFQIDPEKQFTLGGTVGGGNVVTTNNLLKTTGSNNRRQEQGTNFTINVSGHILDEQQNIAQAPIRPRATGEYGGPDLFGFGTFSMNPPIPDDTTAVNANASPYNVGQPSTAFVYNAGGTPTFAGVRGEKLHITSSGVNMGVRYNIPTTEGKEYQITVTVGGDPGSFFFQNAAGATLTTVIGSGNDQSGDEIVTFTADAGGHTQWFIRVNNNLASGGQTNFDNIVIRERITFINGELPGYVERKSSVLLGNATEGRRSNRYYRSVKEIKSHKNVEPFNTNLFPNPTD